MVPWSQTLRGTACDLHQFVLSTKMVDTSPVFCDEVIGKIAGTNVVALRGQAAAVEEASLHHAL